MEQFNLTQTGEEVQQILNTATPQSDLTTEIERAQGAEQTLQGNIDAEELRAKAAERDLELADGTLQSNIDAEELRAKAAEQANADDIEAIESKIPTAASSSNQLADKEFVNSSIATATATYRGTYNQVSDLHLTLEATQGEVATALASAIDEADNNDYCYVQVPVSEGDPTEIAQVDRYKFNGSAWAYEYTLNNSGFTAAQWAALNSAITSGLVAKLTALPNMAELTTLLAGKQNVLTFDTTPTTGSNNPVTSGGVKNALDGEAEARSAADTTMQSAIEGILALIPQAATALNQLADKAFVNSSIATNTGTFKGTYNVVLDLELFYDADHAQIALMLGSKIISAKNNDYCYVQVPNSNETPTSINHTDRYKFNGTSWAYEYTLNNSGFTSAQWLAINSGITELLKNKLVDLPTATELTALLAAKQNQLTFDTAPASGSTNPVTSEGIHAAIDNEKERAQGAEQTLQDNIDDEETRAQSAESTLQDNIDTEHARALAAEQGLLEEYEELYALYQTLQGGNITPVAAADWPLSNLQQNVIYRVANSATPTGYSDYMYNGTNTILLAEFSFPGIDDKPTAGSTNLAYSGGIHASILQDGPAFDLSAHNAVGGTLATYANLDAALAALNALPAAYKYGGMSIKFLQSSDNKYVQFRYMSSSTSAADFTNVDNWQGVTGTVKDDSKDLVESDGVSKAIIQSILPIQNVELNLNVINGRLWNSTTHVSQTSANYKYYKITVTGGVDKVQNYNVMTAIDANIRGMAIYGDGQLINTGYGGQSINTTDLTQSQYQGYSKLEIYVNQLIASESKAILIKNGSLDSTVVKHIAQTLTDEQKAQALQNLGLPTSVDGTPTKDSANLITSGGTYKAIDEAINGKSIVGTITIHEGKVWDSSRNAESTLASKKYIDFVVINDHKSSVLIKNVMQSLDSNIRGVTVYGGTTQIFNTYGGNNVTLSMTDERFATYQTIHVYANLDLATTVDVTTDGVVGGVSYMEQGIRYNYITVQRNSADFNSIRETIAAITDASYFNRYVVQIPSGNWFECDINGKQYVKLVGEDMNKTILYCDGTSDKVTPSDYSFNQYANTPLNEIAGTYKHVIKPTDDIEVENLTILSATYSNGSFGSAADITKYCIHLDSPDYGKAVFKNCIIQKRDYTNPFPVGIGNRTSKYAQDIIFEGCKFLVVTDCWGIYYHNDSNAVAKFDGSLTVRDCWFQGHFITFGELGSDYMCQVTMTNCHSEQSAPNCAVYVEKRWVSSSVQTTYWINPATGQYETNPLNVPYCIKFNYLGSNVAGFEYRTGAWGTSIGNTRPNFFDYCIGLGNTWLNN